MLTTICLCVEERLSGENSVTLPVLVLAAVTTALPAGCAVPPGVCFLSLVTTSTSTVSQDPERISSTGENFRLAAKKKEKRHG